MFRFNWKYFVLAVCLFAIEVAIAIFFQDLWIRGYLGDFFVVILIYAFIQSFFNVSEGKTALGVLLFAIVVEGCQYFQLADVLGIEQYQLAKIILGSTFDWMDILAYFLGIIVILKVEFNRLNT